MRNNKSFHRLASALLAAVMLIPSSAAFAAEEGMSGHAVYWEGSIMMEGHEAYFAQDSKSYEPINYNGNVYVPLFAVGEWTASSVRWDQSAKQINVHYNALQPTYYRTASEMPSRTDAEFQEWRDKRNIGRTTGFEIDILTDTAVVGDLGSITTVTPQGTTLYPIVYEGIPYLSVRTAAQLSGKTQYYFGSLYKRPRPSIYICDKPSLEQVQLARTYLDEVDTRIQQADAYLATLAKAQTTEELHDRLVELKALLLRIEDPSIPSIPTLTQEVLTSIYTYGVDGDNGLRALDPDIAWSADPTSQDKAMWRVRDLHVNNIHVLNEGMSNAIARMRQFVDGMAIGEL